MSRQPTSNSEGWNAQFQPVGKELLSCPGPQRPPSRVLSHWPSGSRLGALPPSKRTSFSLASRVRRPPPGVPAPFPASVLLKPSGTSSKAPRAGPEPSSPRSQHFSLVCTSTLPRDPVRELAPPGNPELCDLLWKVWSHHPSLTALWR